MKKWLIYIIVPVVLVVAGYFAYKLILLTADVLVPDETTTDITPEVVTPTPTGEEEGVISETPAVPKVLGKGTQSFSKTFIPDTSIKSFKLSLSYNSNKLYLDDKTDENMVKLQLADGSELNITLWEEGEASLLSFGSTIQYVGITNNLAIYRENLSKIIKEKGESEGKVYHSYVYYTRELDDNCKGRDVNDKKIVAPCGYDVLNTSLLTKVKVTIVGDYSSSKIDSIIKQFDAVMLTFKLK